VNCQSCSREFTIEPDDFSFYEQMQVPPPTWCPDCRLVRRLSWFAPRMLYKRKCDFTGENVISFYHPDAPYKTYRQDIWWSDKWDPKEYGRDYDFSRPFFEQFKELLLATPLPTLHTDHSTMVQSDYCNAAATLKNCYLCFGADHSENCAYLSTITYMKECFDSNYSNHSELSYQLVNCNKCYRVFYSEDCDECHNVYFSKNLIGCTNCIGCINLRNQSYQIFNQPVSKEEFESQLAELNFGSLTAREHFKKRTREFFIKNPHKAFYGRKNENTSGDYIQNSKNVRNAFMVDGSENMRFVQFIKAGPNAQAYDYTQFGMNSEWIYDSCWVGLSSNTIRFSFWNYHTHHLEYSYGCHGSENLFGCVGIRKGSYCILNKPYAKDEYESLIPKIRQQMSAVPYKDGLGREYRYGEFFPTDICPWKYNESLVYSFFPLNEEEAIRKGFGWRDPDEREYKDATIEIPDDIKDVSDDILKGILKCETCGKNYQIIQMELIFYRRFSIPIPRQCPLCRDFARTALLNPIRIYDRICAKCNAPIKTSYSPDRPEIVYCESCYNTKVV
jgi:hypothetical protein